MVAKPRKSEDLRGFCFVGRIMRGLSHEMRPYALCQRFASSCMPRQREERKIASTGACFPGVTVRITRQRMVGEIARHSGADIAAGVTPGRPWHVPGPASSNRANTASKIRFFARCA